jgi:hypothetical protein
LYFELLPRSRVQERESEADGWLLEEMQAEMQESRLSVIMCWNTSFSPTTEIEIGGAFVEDTSASIKVSTGDHVLAITKKGFVPSQHANEKVAPGPSPLISSHYEDS